jgi:hypothetical protein
VIIPILKKIKGAEPGLMFSKLNLKRGFTGFVR